MALFRREVVVDELATERGHQLRMPAAFDLDDHRDLGRALDALASESVASCGSERRGL